MPMPIVLMLIKFWFCCLFISRKRKEKREIFTITLPAFSTSRLPSLTCVFFSFPTHTLLFFFTNHTPFSLPHYNTSSLSPTYILPFSLSPQHISPSFSSHSNSTPLSHSLSPSHTLSLTLSHRSPPVEVEKSVSAERERERGIV